jgi:hypothetical protein
MERIGLMQEIFRDRKGCRDLPAQQVHKDHKEPQAQQAQPAQQGRKDRKDPLGPQVHKEPQA